MRKIVCVQSCARTCVFSCGCMIICTQHQPGPRSQDYLMIASSADPINFALKKNKQDGSYVKTWKGDHQEIPGLQSILGECRRIPRERQTTFLPLPWKLHRRSTKSPGIEQDQRTRRPRLTLDRRAWGLLRFYRKWRMEKDRKRELLSGSLSRPILAFSSPLLGSPRRYRDRSSKSGPGNGNRRKRGCRWRTRLLPL